MVLRLIETRSHFAWAARRFLGNTIRSTMDVDQVGSPQRSDLEVNDIAKLIIKWCPRRDIEPGHYLEDYECVCVSVWVCECVCMRVCVSEWVSEWVCVSACIYIMLQRDDTLHRKSCPNSECTRPLIFFFAIFSSNQNWVRIFEIPRFFFQREKLKL